jgi:hypothetical protein
MLVNDFSGNLRFGMVMMMMRMMRKERMNEKGDVPKLL